MDETDREQQVAIDRNEIVDARQSRQIDWLTLWLFIFAATSAVGSFFQIWEAITVNKIAAADGTACQGEGLSLKKGRMEKSSAGSALAE